MKTKSARMNGRMAEQRRGGTTFASPDSSSITGDPALASLAQELRASAPDGLPDPAFRESLRARLAAPSAALRYSALETPVGRLWLAYQGGVLRLVSAQDEASFLARATQFLGEAPTRDDTPPERMGQRVLAAIRGQRAYSGQVDLSPLTPFQRAVLERTRQI